MKTIATETVILLNDGKHIFDPCRVHVRIADEAGGPFLCVRGVDDEASGKYRQDEFYLNSHEEIDEFCAILHRILKEAEE